MNLFWVCLLGLGAGCDAIFPSPEATLTSIEIHSDRITYRTGSYETLSALAIGLKASSTPPTRIVLHDCARMDVFEDVVDLVRSEGGTQLQIALPEDC